jgi:starvation-inducible DNA-binding protein
MSNKSVAEDLKQYWHNNYAIYLKTQNYHWNVTGVNFKPLHILFEEQYNDIITANDGIASIKDGDETADATSMVKKLANGQEVMVSLLKTALNAAQEADDEVTIGASPIA